MAVRRRGKTAEIASDEKDHPDDEPESPSLKMNTCDSKKGDSTCEDDNQEPLLGTSAREGHSSGSSAVARSGASVGVFLQNVGNQLRNMDFKNASLEAKAGLQAYFSAARDWLSDVPALMQRMQDCLPDSFQAYAFTLSMPLTPEQQACVPP